MTLQIMRISLPWVLVILSVVLSLDRGIAHAQYPGLITSLGIVHVVESGAHYAIMLDDRLLHSIEERGFVRPRIMVHIGAVGDYAEVLLFERSRLDSSGMHRFLFTIAIKPDGSSVASDEVPSPKDVEPRIIRTGSRFTINVPPTRNAGGVGKVWTFRDGNLVPSERRR